MKTEELSETGLYIKIGASFKSKEEAIHEACKLLAGAGCVDTDYAESMLNREKTANTFLGAGLAIPHGCLEDKGRVFADGLAILQVPAGVAWGHGQTARLIVAIAAKGDGHITVLRRLAALMGDEALMNHLAETKNGADIKAALLNQDMAEDAPSEPLTDYATAREWKVDYPAGLHARPATAWVSHAKSTGILLRVRHDNECADPRNLVSLLKLGVREHDLLVISADGNAKAANSALDSFFTLITTLSISEKENAAKAAQKALLYANKKNTVFWNPPSGGSMTLIEGVPASPGLCAGTVFKVNAQTVEVEDNKAPLLENARLLDAALRKTKQQLTAVIDDTFRRLGAADAAIFQAHLALLNDEELITDCSVLLVDGHGAAWAWNKAVQNLSNKISQLNNEILALRAADIRDVGMRVLALLAPEEVKRTAFTLPESAGTEKIIILAEDLAPSDTAGLDGSVVAGIATSAGGPSAHTAILARTMGIPAVVAAGNALFSAQNGQPVILDGESGRVWLSPSEAALCAAQVEITRRETERSELVEKRALPAVTKDGQTVIVGANINTPEQAPLALDMGAEGIGLMRTEFLFLERGDIPGEDEQFETYRAMAKAMEGKPVIIRALDIGGDKQVAHLNLPKEENPFLGVRGARLLLRRRDLLIPQLRALYRAAKEYPAISIMFPMISSLSELETLREISETVRSDLGAPRLALGVMIEVPSAAVLSGVLADKADFFSIGTNDLTQYTLAMDRQNPALAGETDGLHPAVLHLIAQTIQSAKRYHKPCGVCGGIACDKLGAAILTGLGIDELSMTPRDIPVIKGLIRSRTRKQFHDLAHKALTMASPEQTRSLLAEIETIK